MRRTIATLAGLAPALILPVAADAATVGSAKVHSRVATTAKGVAQAYRFRTPSSGQVNRLNVFLDKRSTARRVQLGIYGGTAGRTGVRRARCTIRMPRAGAWNRCTIAATAVTAGRRTWLAVLQPQRSKGRLRYRVRKVSGRLAAHRSKSRRLRALPRKWGRRDGGRRAQRASIYADDVGNAGPPDLTPGPGPQPGPGPSHPPVPTGFPDASTTGVPAGRTLTSSGPITVTQAGAVIDGVDTPSVTVNAPNVTIRNSRIHGSASYLVQSNSTGLVVEDSELDGQGANNVGAGSSDFTLRRVEITGSENGMNISGANVTVEDSFIHDLTTDNGAHTDGAQIGEGAHDIVFRHNYIRPNPDAVWRSTSAIIMWNEGGTQNTRVRIEGNLLDGTGATVAVYAPRQPASAIYINSNRMLKGASGHTDSVEVPRTVTEFSGNVDDKTGAALRP